MMIDRILLVRDKRNDWLRNAVVFQVDNIAELWVTLLERYVPHYKASNLGPYMSEDFAEGPPTEGNRFLKQEIPNAAPIAPLAWFEWQRGAGIDARVRSHGVSVSVLHDSGVQPEMYRWSLWLQHHKEYTRPIDGLHHGLADDGETATIHVYADGSMRGYERTIGEKVYTHKMNDMVHEFGAVALLSMCFAHCKNVAVVDHQPTRQVRRQAERIGQPAITYKTLEIDPGRTTTSDIARPTSGSSVARRLHICRGHFSHYTDAAPLFGKLVGTYYVPMHTRGSRKVGLAYKDYRVMAGTNK